MAMEEKEYLNILKQLAIQVDVTHYMSSRLFLSDLYKNAKEQIDRFSYRIFANVMGFGATNYLHLICSGKRQLSRSAALKISDALDLSAKKKNYLLTLSEYESARKPIEREQKLSQLAKIAQSNLKSELSKEELEYFSKWYHPVIREMIGMKNFNADPKWITTQIIPRISVDQAEKSLKLLERIGYISFDPKENTYVQTTKHVRTPKEVKGLAICHYHQQMINIGRESIMNVKAKRRDVSAITINVDTKLAEEIKAEIQKFRADILKKSERINEGNQIYQLNIQWFPFTQEDDDVT